MEHSIFRSALRTEFSVLHQKPGACSQASFACAVSVLFDYLSNSLSMHFICLVWDTIPHLCLSVSPLVLPFVLFTCLSVRLSICLCTGLYISLPVCVAVFLIDWLSVTYLHVFRYVLPVLEVSVCLLFQLPPRWWRSFFLSVRLSVFQVSVYRTVFIYQSLFFVFLLISFHLIFYNFGKRFYLPLGWISRNP